MDRESNVLECKCCRNCFAILPLFRIGTQWQDAGSNKHCETVNYANDTTYSISAKQIIDFWSGRRDSNPRRPAWEAGILPTELLPLSGRSKYIKDSALCARSRWVSLRIPDSHAGQLLAGIQLTKSRSGLTLTSPVAIGAKQIERATLRKRTAKRWRSRSAKVRTL